MAALPFFKKKEESKKKTVTKKAPVVKAEKKEVKKTSVKKIASNGIFLGSLTAPHVTEKATVLAEKNQYVFKVSPTATKLVVKQDVESQYKVTVEKVRMITVPSKKKRMGKIMGVKKGYRKAIVKVKEGQSIQILPR